MCKLQMDKGSERLGNVPNVTQQMQNQPWIPGLPAFAFKPPVSSPLPPNPKPRNREMGQCTHLAVYHLGMLQDGNDVAHHSHAQLIHDFFVKIQQHALLDPVGEGQQ